jgi:hypothetical protein
MISFKCSGCEYLYDVPEKYAGKRVRCKHCNEVLIVPTPNTNANQIKPSVLCTSTFNESPDPASDNDSVKQDSGSISAIPMWTWCLFGAFGLIFVAFLLWMFVIRDTWEIDHYQEISQITLEVKSSVNNSDFNSATEKYHKLKSLIGNRALINEDLKQTVTVALNEYETLRKEKERQVELAQQAKKRLEFEAKIVEIERQKVRAEALAEAERQRDALAKAERQRYLVEERKQRQVEREKMLSARSQIDQSPKIAGIYYDADKVISYIPTEDKIEEIVISHAIDKTNLSISISITQRSADKYSRAVDNPRYYGTSVAAELELYHIQEETLKDLANLKQISANYERGCMEIKNHLIDSDFKNRWDGAVTKHRNSDYLPNIIKNNLSHSYEF